MKKNIKSYLLIAFVWTWSGWISAYVISYMQNIELLTDVTFISLWTDILGTDRFLSTLIFSLAVYGPFVGYIVTVGLKKVFIGKIWNVQPYCYYVLLIPLVSIVPTLILSAFTSNGNPENLSLTAITTTVFMYFISNLITSGTEEFGWRGFLYPQMKKSGMPFWDIAWKGGLIWAAWHLPLLVIMYAPLGFAVLIPSLAGFAASIVAMNYITNFIYEKTNNIWFAVILHALNNTMSFFVVLLFPGTPFMILSSLMAWVIVWRIEKKYALDLQ